MMVYNRKNHFFLTSMSGYNAQCIAGQSGYSPVCRRSREEGPDTRTRDSIIQAWPAPALLGKLISQLEGWCLDAGLSLAGAGIAGLGLAERLVRAGRVFNYPPQPRETRADNWRGRNTEYTIIHSTVPSSSQSDEQEGGYNLRLMFFLFLFQYRYIMMGHIESHKINATQAG